MRLQEEQRESTGLHDKTVLVWAKKKRSPALEVLKVLPNIWDEHKRGGSHVSTKSSAHEQAFINSTIRHSSTMELVPNNQRSFRGAGVSMLARIQCVVLQRLTMGRMIT